MLNPLYRHTNESLDAILAGLVPRADDCILAIGGSGDQAFAMLAKGASVTVVDQSEEQIAYIRARVAALQRGWYAGFFDDMHFRTDSLPERQWLVNSTRLRRIRTHLDRLTILEPQDIFPLLADGVVSGFNKLYLSNIPWRQNTLQDIFRNLAAHLQPGGQVYIADSNLLCDYARCASPCTHFLPQGMRLNLAKSLKAEFIERRATTFWSPGVYEK